ncbi:serine hydrolase domain-containing protein [Marilutibacter alkalisoli]|uniref:Beta-lactamase family protein n=1 Tax=Marilutibacter alkalisoli TaxID=2591633 RepID=A0A514BPH8_9GAMM|nr:serine hydrolase domain-containing protein [Lysobacter alkalisoli]QDH69283.1 beta-lactamase family protein [Lysobacter alkalisoli]
MKDKASGRTRVPGRLAALSVLLTLALGSAAQTSQSSRTSPLDRFIADTVSTTSSAPLPPEFDVQRFERMAQQLVADRNVPALAMAIVHEGKVLSARGYGVTDMQNARPVDSHTVFRLASLSKGFASTMAGLVVNDGALRWDSRVDQYLPDFRLSDPHASQQVSVADLLSHRLGLPYNAYDRDLERYVDYRTLTRRLSTPTLKCQPGTCYAYQNVAFSLIGDIVFAATGNFYSEEVQRRLFKPLGMNDASLGLEGIESSPSWARPHVRTRGGWVSVSPKPTYYQLPPAAGVNASASDMAQWLIAQTGHRPDVIARPLLATLHEPLVDTPGEMRASWRRERLSSAGYALGWRVYDYAGQRMIYHGGAVQGYRGMIAMLPQRELGVVVVWNSESSLPSGLVPTILDSALGLPEGKWLGIDLGAVDLPDDEQPQSATAESRIARTSRPR